MKRLILALATVALAGCAATPVAQPAPTAEPISAASTCSDLSNMLTLLYNASTSNDDGRLNGQELSGAVALSDALLDDVDVEPGTGLADEVAILQNLGAEFGVINFDYGAEARPEFGEWNASIDNVDELCRAEGIQFGVMGWTGG